MPISFHCKCGRKLKVADAMAGRSGKCPACGVALIIPQSNDPYETVQTEDAPQRPCPACQKPMAAAAVVCTHCGYHRVTGTRMRTTEEEKREETSRWQIRIGGQSKSLVMLILLVVGGIAAVVWYWRGPMQPLLIRSRQYVHATDTFIGGTTKNDGSYGAGGDDAVVVLTPAPDGDYVLMKIGIKQSLVAQRKQIAGYNSVFSDTQFKLQPADGSAPLPVRLLAMSYPQSITVDITTGSDFHQLLPPVPPTDLQTRQAKGYTEGKARYLDPKATGEIDFSTIAGMGGTAYSGSSSARGNVQMPDIDGNPIELNYTGDKLIVTWPKDDCVGYWVRHQFNKPTRSDFHRFDFALLVPRPATGGTHTLLYCDKPVAKFRTVDPPPPRQIAASPLKPKTAEQQAASKARANDPLNYFSDLARAKQRAEGIVSASNINQFSIAIQAFVDERKRFPESLLELVDYNPELKQLLTNPRTGDVPGFIYEPPKPGSTPHDTPILWESLEGKKDPEGAILYADFHME